MRKFAAYAAFYAGFEYLTLQDGTENDIVANFIRLSTSVSPGESVSSAWQVCLTLMLFLPLLLEITSSKGVIERLKIYILTRKDLPGYRRLMICHNLKALNLVIAAKLLAEAGLAFPQLVKEPGQTLVIAGLNLLYYLWGVTVILAMELLKSFTSLSYKKLLAAAMFFVLIAQYFQGFFGRMALAVTPVPAGGADTWKVAATLRAVEILCLSAILCASVKREEKRGVL